MVNQLVKANESTQVIETAKQKSFARLMRHLCYLPFKTQQYFNADVQQAITLAVEEAEQQHRGEIQVVIEGNLPVHQAYVQDAWARANELFAQLKVWDTEYNSGILLYINLCERSIDIVVDRGINRYIDNQAWQTIIADMTPYFKDKKFSEGVCLAIKEIGEQLQLFYVKAGADMLNELPNTPIFK